MALSVRQAKPDDAKALASVHVDAWQAAYRGLIKQEFLDGVTLASRSARWQETLHGDDHPPVLVADQDGAIVGFCVVAAPSRDDDAGEGTAEVVALNVSPQIWRAGVGTALLDEALAGFERDGWHTASLWVVDGNTRALSFYQRFGFKADGATKVRENLGVSELRMSRTLRRSS